MPSDSLIQLSQWLASTFEMGPTHTNNAPNMGRGTAHGPIVGLTFSTDTKVSNDTLVHLFGPNPSDVISMYRRSGSMRAWSNQPVANRE
jgi:hypothetical protein